MSLRFVARGHWERDDDNVVYQKTGPREWTLKGADGQDMGTYETLADARAATHGNCYATAYDFMFELALQNPKIVNRYRLCHGLIDGKGPLTGTRFVHAWVEALHPKFGTMCLDDSNGGDIRMPAAQYYFMAGVRRNEVKRYTWKEAAENILRTNGQLGPWHNFGVKI